MASWLSPKYLRIQVSRSPGVQPGSKEHDESCARLLQGAMRALDLSARGYSRVLKVARTIADLAGESKIGLAHIAEAIQYRERSQIID